MVPGAPLLTAILSRRKQLDLPHTSFALLPKFDAGKPGSETGINHAAEVHGKQIVTGSTHGPAAGGRRCASLSLLRLWKAGVLPRSPASGPEGARRRRLRARRKPAPLLLEARPGLPALLAAPGGAQSRQALLLQSPPAGHSEPRRASGRLLVRPAAQQLLGKVGLLHTAAATGAEQRAASATAAHKCDRAMPGCSGLSTRSASPRHPDRLHLPRSQHELLWHEEAGA